MPRYDRNEYRMDWRMSKSDILRSRKAVAQRRKIRLASVLGILGLMVVIIVTLVNIFESVNKTLGNG